MSKSTRTETTTAQATLLGPPSGKETFLQMLHIEWCLGTMHKITHALKGATVSRLF